jgi:hypothetical protein
MPDFKTTKTDCLKQSRLGLDKSQEPLRNALKNVLYRHHKTVTAMEARDIELNQYSKFNPKRWKLNIKDRWNNSYSDILTELEITFVNKMLADVEDITNLFGYFSIPAHFRYEIFINGRDERVYEFKASSVIVLHNSFETFRKRRDRYKAVQKWQSDDMTISQVEWDELSS